MHIYTHTHNIGSISAAHMYTWLGLALGLYNMFGSLSLEKTDSPSQLI